MADRIADTRLMIKIILIYALFVLAVLWAAGCGGVKPAPPIPPNPHVNFQTGLVAWPGQISQEECDEFAQWHPLVRMPVQTADQVALSVELGQACEFRVQLLVEDINYPLVQGIAGVAQRAYAVELGNEISNRNPEEVNAFWRSSYSTLRSEGFPGVVVSGGIPNLEPDTLAWLDRAALNLPSDMRIGWHAYADWPTYLASFVQRLNGHTCSMTEWGGYPQVNQLTVADRVRQEGLMIKNAGCDELIYYQLHSGTNPGEDFGLHNGEWRTPTVDALASLR